MCYGVLEGPQGDLVNEISFVRDYDHEITEVPDAGDLVCIKSVPHEGVPVVWGWLITAVDPESLLPQWERSYDESGDLLRTMVFSKPRTFGARTIPTMLTLTPHHKEESQTSFEYMDMEFDVELKGDIFSLRNLRSRH